MPAELEGLGGAARSLLRQGMVEMNLHLSSGQVAQIERYLALVDKWRSKINLVSVSGTRELITHHALDSLAVLPFIMHSRRVLDVGTGAGFPGMMLAAARPDTRFELLDSRRRRVEFLRMVNTRLGLHNVTFFCTRVNDLVGPDDESRSHSEVRHAMKFDTLVARAVASLEQLVSMTAALRYPGQRLVALKGQYPQQELEALEYKHADSIALVKVEPIKVPFLDARRHVVTIEYQ